MHFKHEQIFKYDEDYTIVGATPTAPLGAEAYINRDNHVHYVDTVNNNWCGADTIDHGQAPRQILVLYP